MPNYNYDLIIIATLVGFFTLAAALLVPIWRFLKKQEKVSAEWTEEKINALKQNNEA